MKCQRGFAQEHRSNHLSCMPENRQTLFSNMPESYQAYRGSVYERPEHVKIAAKEVDNN